MVIPFYRLEQKKGKKLSKPCKPWTSTLSRLSFVEHKLRSYHLISSSLHRSFVSSLILPLRFHRPPKRTSDLSPSPDGFSRNLGFSRSPPIKEGIRFFFPSEESRAILNATSDALYNCFVSLGEVIGSFRRAWLTLIVEHRLFSGNWCVFYDELWLIRFKFFHFLVVIFRKFLTLSLAPTKALSFELRNVVYVSYH